MSPKIDENHLDQCQLELLPMPHLTDIFADCKYLYLDKLLEPADNQLAMRVLEATDGGPVPTAILDAQPLEPVKEILAQARTIEHCSGCRIFDITWRSYVGYSVLNESFALPEPETSICTGRLFVEYKSSTYLEYLKRASWACADYPGPYRHWAALCLNHIVDVASVDEPTVAVSVAGAPPLATSACRPNEADSALRVFGAMESMRPRSGRFWFYRKTAPGRFMPFA